MESPKALIAPLKRGIWGINKASSDAGPELAGREACGDGKPEGPDRPLEKGDRGD